MWTFLPFPLAYIHKRGIFDIDQSGLQSPSQFSEIRLSAIEPTPNARIPPSSSEAWTEGAGGMRSVKANTSPAKPLALRRFNLVFAASLGAIMLIVALAISPAENCVFAQLIPALRDIHLPVQTRISISDAGPFLKAFEFLLLSTLAAASIWIGKHRKLPELAIVSAQLYVVSLAVQIAAFAISGMVVLSLTYLITILTGTACGALLRRLADREKLIEGQYYELLLRNKDLEETRLALVKQNEIERRLLAADLHDQVLNDLKKILEAFKRFEENNDKELSEQIRAGFSKSMTDIREIMDDLSPVMLQNFGLRAAIEDCLEKGRERGGFETSFACEVDDEQIEKLSMVEQTLLFRLVQESITNICKHAQAGHVEIRIINKQPNSLRILIEDDGKGVDYKNVSHQSRGLRYMKYRADLIGAVVEWCDAKKGTAGKGTLVCIDLPYPDKPSAD